MRRKMILIPIVFAVALGFLAHSTNVSAQKVIRWKGQMAFAPSKTGFGPFKIGQAGLGAYTPAWTDWLKKASGGRLVIDWAEPNAMFPVRDSDLAVGKNVAQISSGYSAYWRGRIPETDIETGGVFFWENEAQCFECLHKYGLYKAIQEVYAKHNLLWIPQHSDAVIGIATTFPAPNIDSIKGKKIRAVGMIADYIRALGGSPVSMPYGEIYMAMKLGTVDGVASGIGMLEDLKIKEIAKGFVHPPNINGALGSIIINMDAFKALPEDLQDLLQRDAPYVTYALSTMWHNQCVWIKNHAEKEYGIKMYAWSPEDIAKVTRIVMEEIYPRIAKRSKDCARLLEIVKRQMRDYGRID